MVWAIKPVFRSGRYALQSVINAPYLPGRDEPQVTAYGLEEEVDYYAPGSALKTKMIIRGSLIAR